ncbi:ABC transporter ATP-binding protein [Herbivorax sp. ANBcel31]|uniref:ABC transporter ATP-binding protein n=1 Tax=Herbivorax sp. ANBcel31 TaxID=3069754 RepID=UPI0027B01B61|nr:ABC transporter ATP-binding protein [Herbivorax sp. ANBcel31]MDQ2087993.1 ABC transporter ATP-binding protein [Herbivorax sp. ANBcel31]
MKIVEINNLTKYYGKFRALNEVDLNIKRGECIGFLGPNGAGKTTTIRILLGLLRKSSGEAKLFGKDVWSDSVDIHKKLAYVPGDVHLWPNLTGGEVIDLFGKLRGGLNQGKRKDLLELFDLDPTKKCSTYSKGNRQKVGLISAFSSDVDFYILDEPTSGLDPLMTAVFQDCVKNLKKQGKTVLMSSHILADVEKLCDKVTIIRQGEIVESGTLDQLRHMTKMTISVETNNPVKEIDKIESVSNISTSGNTTTFQIDKNMVGEAIEYLVRFNIKSVVSTPPTLEELFMKHYGEDVKSNNNARREP